MQDNFMEDNFMQDNFMQVTLFFLLNPVSFNGNSYQKQRRSRTRTSRSSGYKKSYSFIRYILSDQV